MLPVHGFALHVVLASLARRKAGLPHPCIPDSFLSRSGHESRRVTIARRWELSGRLWRTRGVGRLFALVLLTALLAGGCTPDESEVSPATTTSTPAEEPQESRPAAGSEPETISHGALTCYVGEKALGEFTEHQQELLTLDQILVSWWASGHAYGIARADLEERNVADRVQYSDQWGNVRIVLHLQGSGDQRALYGHERCS